MKSKFVAFIRILRSPPFEPPAVPNHRLIFTTTTLLSGGESNGVPATVGEPIDAIGVLRAWGCTQNDVSEICRFKPGLCKVDATNLRSKLTMLAEIGFSSSDLVKIARSRPRFLGSFSASCLYERVTFLRSLFASDDLFRKAIIRNPAVLTYDLDKVIKPSVELYEKLEVSRRDLASMLLSRPTIIPRSSLNDEKLDYITKTGVPRGSNMFKYVVSIFAVSRIDTIREKIANLQKFGLSEDEVFRLLGTSPYILTLSAEKVQRNMTFAMGSLKLPANAVLSYPFLLYSNLETSLKPRMLLARKIEEMDLVPRIEGPRIFTALRMAEKRFVEAFIRCHPKDIAEELMEYYGNVKCVKRLAEASKKNLKKGFPF